MPKKSRKPVFLQSKRHKNRLLSHLVNNPPKNSLEYSSNIDYEEIIPSDLATVSGTTSSAQCSTALGIEQSDSDNDCQRYLQDNHSYSEFNDCEAYISDYEPVDSSDESVFDESELPDQSPPSFSEKLAEWAIKGNVTHKNLNDLLVILREHSCFDNLPKDSRTLLSTPRKYSPCIRIVNPGKYFHFGLEKGICEVLKYNGVVTNIPETLDVQINIDGIPLAKSSGSQFWPILGALPQLGNIHPFVIGAYHGLTKPECSNSFLEEFVSEVNILLKEGILYSGQNIIIHLTAFICDAPARAFIKKVKGHTGYFGCDRCIQKGIHYDNRIIFPEMNSPLCTDSDFTEQNQKEHHNGISILNNISGIKMISHFPQDYMHLVCLGAMRKLVLLWMRGKIPIRLPGSEINRFSEVLTSITNVVPCEFARKPRSLREIDRWKATEFRQLLLYSGPLVFKAMRKKLYTHFLALNCAIRILADPKVETIKIDEAQNLILYFLQYYAQLYGDEQVSYNVHSLLHLADDVRRYGHLDMFSAFKFESHLYTIKKQIRNSALPLQQLIRRTLERREVCSRAVNLTKKYPLLQQPHTEGPLYGNMCESQYKKAIFKEFSLCLNRKDNCVQLDDGSICVIDNIGELNEETVFIGRAFLRKQDFFEKPCRSSQIGIFEVSNLSLNRKMWNKCQITRKAMKLPIGDNKFYIALLLHN